MDTRISRDEWGLLQAEVTLKRSTCLRRHVGCVLVNSKGHVLGTGYNGVAAGRPHCNEWATSSPNGKTYPNACKGWDAPSGTQLEACEAIHAEQNALIQCGDVWQIHTCYVTVSPCIHCVKLLLNTSCQRIVFRKPYAHDEMSRKLWVESVREWVHLGQ